jgi:hypothetical protein
LDGHNVTDPILQILQMKNIQNNMDGLTRYKVTLFDGETQHTCKYILMSCFIFELFVFYTIQLKLVYWPLKKTHWSKQTS